jgi:hypothetical protein
MGISEAGFQKKIKADSHNPLRSVLMKMAKNTPCSNFTATTPPQATS